MEIDIIRVWKDKRYRNSLSTEQKALLPENPIGFAELSDEELDLVTGGIRPDLLLPAQPKTHNLRCI
jgi:mersacidin/lichenicidin family type 2 lantibiotic